MPVEAGQAITPAGRSWEGGGAALLRRAAQRAGWARGPRRSIHRSSRTSSRSVSAACGPLAPAWRCVPSPAPVALPRPPGEAASLPPAAPTRRRPAPLAPVLLAQGARHPGVGEGVREARSRGAPHPHPHRPACTGRRCSGAARRAAPCAPAALLRRCPLPARSPPDTDSLPPAACGSDRRRRSCCGRRKDKQQPGSRRSSPAPSHLGVRSRLGKGREGRDDSPPPPPHTLSPTP